jgi:hypothetical protein
MIQNAEADSVIHLPEVPFRLPGLLLTKPITIKGLPGTIIEIEGPIIINF